MFQLYDVLKRIALHYISKGDKENAIKVFDDRSLCSTFHYDEGSELWRASTKQLPLAIPSHHYQPCTAQHNLTELF